MVCKERDPRERPGQGTFGEAAAAAQEHVGVLLRHAFAEDPDIWVFNDLRYQDDSGSSVEIDHLILHRHGFVVVDSGSVCIPAQVDGKGEWTCVLGGRTVAVNSPVEQLRQQGEFLRRALDAYCEDLLGRFMGVRQVTFQTCPFDPIVAVAESASLTREVPVPELAKAGEVADRIREIYGCRRKVSASFALESLRLSNNEGIYNFKDREMAAIKGFLLEHHCPRPAGEPPAPPAEAEPSAPAAGAEAPTGAQARPGVCAACGGPARMAWANRTYFWRCRSCGADRPILLFCTRCGRRMLLKRQGNRFLKSCENCRTEGLYFQE